MISKEIIDLIASKTGIKWRSLIEKDMILHRLLIELSSDKHFFENYAFKGGTCLMKCYISYYRFSEDLDFTYVNQKEFENKSGKQRRSIMSEKINT
jgi:predicted nucleotidyltransferase component of viral defense system